jgi:hypothetical protein
MPPASRNTKTPPTRHEFLQYKRNSDSEETMTRYELATLSIGMGTAPKAAEAIAAYAAESGAGGKLLGCWVSDIGALNTIAVLRGFEDDAELARERDRTLKSSSPFGCAEYLTRLSLDSYAPFPGLPPVEVGAFGPVYEIRSYVLKTGGLAPTFEGWDEKLPARTEISKLVIAMYALDGVPRITHIWPYASVNDRTRLRAESVQRGTWPPKSAVWLTPEMQSTIYLPTAISPLK